MEFNKYPKIPRLNRNMVITEKIDGTNAQIYITPVKSDTRMMEDFEIKGWRVFGDPPFQFGVVPGSRNRLLTLKKDNFGFCKWVNENAEDLINLGPGRHFGEWWGAGIQRRYGLDHKRFSLFNVSRWKTICSDAEGLTAAPGCCSVIPILHEGLFRTGDIREVLYKLQTTGSIAAPGFMDPEGIVIFHEASSQMFKVTIKNDEIPKGLI